MGYELRIPLKAGMLEIEFDTPADLERQLSKLDLARVERAVLSALQGVRPAQRSPRAKRRASRKKGARSR